MRPLNRKYGANSADMWPGYKCTPGNFVFAAGCVTRELPFH